AVNLNNYRILYVPSGDPETPGGISQADKDSLALRATDIKNFVRSGGGVFALTEDTLTNPYSWLQLPAPFTIDVFTGGLGGPGCGPNSTTTTHCLYQTPALTAAGFVITD